MMITFTTGAVGYQNNPYAVGYATGFRTASTIVGATLGGWCAYNRGIRKNDDPNRLVARTLVGATAWGLVYNAIAGAAVNIGYRITW